MYEWPTTQPMSLVKKYVSPGLPQKICCIARRAPPRSRRCRAARPWACRSSRGVEDVARPRWIRASAPARRRRVSLAQRGVVVVAPATRCIDASPGSTRSTMAGSVRCASRSIRPPAALCDDLAAWHAGVAADHDLRPRVVDAVARLTRRTRRTPPNGWRRARTRASRRP